MPPDTPRGRPRSGTASHANDTPAGAIITVIVARADDIDRVVLARLVDLHDHGMITRAELEREFGVPYRALAAAARTAG